MGYPEPDTVFGVTYQKPCLEDTTPLSTAKQGVYLQQIINGLYESAAKSEAVKLSEHVQV
ncbi:hypothetical protein ACIQAA_12080 [Neobacillus sp. NPDC093182]|uniref:hypothetical protein n=1 Tax=Neobacillus sp. NPDC093182 TaxID=3364297 RepID=UPI00380D5F84